MEKEIKDAPAPKNEGQAPSNEVVTETKHSNNKVLIIVLVVVGVLTFLGIAGAVLLGTVFKSASEKLVEEATNTNITTNKDGTATYESKDGSTSVSTEQKLPSDFPLTVPLYPNQKITGSYKQNTDTGHYWQITTETSDAITKVVSNIKEAYSKAPWETEAEVESNGSFTLSYAKTGYKVSVIISENSDMDMTSLIYSVTHDTKTE